VHMGTANFFLNCYDHTFFKIDAKAAVTDAPANTWCRAPGTVEGIGMIENTMDHIAFILKKDPVDVRIANLPTDSKMHTYLLDFIKSTGKLKFSCIPSCTYVYFQTIAVEERKLTYSTRAIDGPNEVLQLFQ
jgi:hypothetical protein